MSGEVSTIIDVLRVIFGLAFMGYASYTDIKTRKVKDKVWLLMAACGGVLLFMQLLLEKRAWAFFLILLPVFILYWSMIIEHKPLFDEKKKKLNFEILGIYMVGIVALLYSFIALAGETYLFKLLAIIVLIVLFFFFYQIGVLHGGADTKALMTLAILVPFYPRFSVFPLISFSSERTANAMEFLFPFAFVVLLNSVLIAVWMFLGFLIYNMSKKDIAFPEMLLGYRLDIEEVEKRFVWPMEKVKDGKRVRVLFPRGRSRGVVKKLKKLGAKRIWVTPKTPFIVFLFIGFVVSVFIGNLFAAVIGLII